MTLSRRLTLTLCLLGSFATANLGIAGACPDPAADCTPIESIVIGFEDCQAAPSGSLICCKAKKYIYRCQGDPPNTYRQIIHLYDIPASSCQQLDFPAYKVCVDIVEPEEPGN